MVLDGYQGSDRSFLAILHQVSLKAVKLIGPLAPLLLVLTAVAILSGLEEPSTS